MPHCLTTAAVSPFTKPVRVDVSGGFTAPYAFVWSSAVTAAAPSRP
jgi:hypothetical protein